MHTTERIAAESNGRIVALDVLRCVAVVLVLFRHIDRPELVGPEPVASVFTALASFGWIGVDLFFVLSGFLVAGLLFEERRRHGRVDVARFLWRRGWKIYPSYYALLLVTVCVRDHAAPMAWLWEALFVQNYLQPNLWTHTWSLAVEEHFYLLLALLFAVANTRRVTARSPHALPVAILAFGIAVLAWRLMTGPAESHRLLFATHLRLDALAFGALLGFWWCHHRVRTVAIVTRLRTPIAFAALALLAPSILLDVDESRWVRTFGLTTNYLACGGIVMLAVTSRRVPGRCQIELARLGACSYSIYLWHMPVQEFCRWHVAPTSSFTEAAACYVVGSLLIGMLSARLLEWPMLRLRDRLPWFARSNRVAVPT